MHQTSSCRLEIKKENRHYYLDPLETLTRTLSTVEDSVTCLRVLRKIGLSTKTQLSPRKSCLLLHVQVLIKRRLSVSWLPEISCLIDFPGVPIPCRLPPSAPAPSISFMSLNSEMDIKNPQPQQASDK